MNAHFDLTPESGENVNGLPHSEPGISAPSRVFVRAKLQMTQSGDPEEREADEIADTVLRDGRIARSVSPGSSGGGVAVPSQYGERLASLQGHGSRLYGDLKDRMESGFGRDFSDVRLHTGNDAAEMSDGISARAFTLGSDIYFNRGEFNPGTHEGQRLIAHELAHVSQQNGKISRQEVDETESGQEAAAAPSAVPDTVPNPDTVAEAAKTESPQKEESHSERLKQVVASGNLDAFISLLIDTAKSELEYKERHSVTGGKIVDRIMALNQKEKLTDVEKKEKEAKEKELKRLFNRTDQDGNPNKDFIDLYEGKVGVDGGGDFTKFQHDLGQDWAQGQAWCDWFVHWCFVKAFSHIDFKGGNDSDEFKRIRDSILAFTMYETDGMKGSVSQSMKYFGKNAYLRDYTEEGMYTESKWSNSENKYIEKPIKVEAENETTFLNRIKNARNLKTSAEKDSYKRRYSQLKLNKKNAGPGVAKPRRGDVVFFIGHIGIVESVTETDGKVSSITTIEGNTTNGRFSSNGGGVFEKSYSNNPNDPAMLGDYQNIIGYGRPDYQGLMDHLKEVYEEQEKQQEQQQEDLSPMVIDL